MHFAKVSVLTKSQTKKHAAILVTLSLLAGCDQKTSDEHTPAPEPNEIGRWLVVPASNVPLAKDGQNYWTAWRMDTKTGDLEFCIYDPGGFGSGPKSLSQPPSLNCGPMEKGPRG